MIRMNFIITVMLDLVELVTLSLRSFKGGNLFIRYFETLCSLKWMLHECVACVSVLIIFHRPVAGWEPKLSDDIKDWVVMQTNGYCGADLKALCAEATLISLRRTYPQVCLHRMLDRMRLNINAHCYMSC
jgi:hypothetical protein